MAGSTAGMSRTQRRAVRWLVAAAIAAYLPIIGAPLRGWFDFAAYWAAGHFALTPQVLDIGVVVRYEVDHGLPPVPFVYPPGIALLFAPLAQLPFAVAALVHVAIAVAALIVAARLWADLVGIPRGWATLGALAWGPAAASVISGQNATIVLLLAVLVARGLALAPQPGRLPGLRTGILAGLAMYKPQLGAPVTALAAVRGGRLVLAGIGVAALIQYVAGIIATGGDPWWPRAWLSTIGAYATADYEANGWQAISLPSIGARIGVLTGSVVPVVIGWAAAIGFVAWAVRGIRRMPVVGAIGLATAAGLVIDPHAWVYDATLALPAIGILAAAAARRGWPRGDRIALAAAFAIGSLWPLGGFVGTTFVPLVVVATPIALRRAASVELASAPAAAPSSGA